MVKEGICATAFAPSHTEVAFDAGADGAESRYRIAELVYRDIDRLALIAPGSALINEGVESGLVAIDDVTIMSNRIRQLESECMSSLLMRSQLGHHLAIHHLRVGESDLVFPVKLTEMARGYADSKLLFDEQCALSE